MRDERSEMRTSSFRGVVRIDVWPPTSTNAGVWSQADFAGELTQIRKEVATRFERTNLRPLLCLASLRYLFRCLVDFTILY